MGGEEDILYRPVLRGVMPVSAMDDPAVDLGLFVEVCEALDVEAENRARQAAWDIERNSRGK